MALIRDLSKAQLAFQVTGRDVDEFEVLRYRGSEGLCQLYRFEIELAGAQAGLAFDAIVGKPAVLTINTDYGERWFHGLVSRFELTGETVGQNYYRAELVPSLWLLTHRYGSRIFQNKTVPEIVSDVLTRGGIPTDQVRNTGITGDHQPREYCVQYRETDYNFICRLMEEEGIRWYFEQSMESHVLVLEDGEAAGYAPISGEPGLEYRDPTGLRVEQEHVFGFRLGQSVRPGAVMLSDFNFKNPALSLEAKSDCGRDTGLEFFDYPGEYVEQNTGRGLAKLRAQEFEAGRTVGVGRSNSPRLAPGRTFELTAHPSGLDGQYLLTAVRYEGKQATTRASTGADGRSGVLDARLHQALIAARQDDNTTIRDLAESLLQIVTRLRQGDQTAHRALTQWLYHAGQVTRDLGSVAGASGGNPLDALTIPNLLDDVARAGLIEYDAPVYECRFECIPSSVSYRPPRLTPWPQMRGSQTARVVGPQGEEIHTDEYGRVKVQFNWDREGKFDDNSSCWIRVSQSFAGGGYGMLFLPRIGQEVIVDFLEGDPDQPIITGRVFNNDQMPPYKLPDEKTKSAIKTNSSKGGGGTNEIRFEDLKDSEQILIYAQKDLHVRVNNDCVENIDHDHHQTVKEQKFELVKKQKHSEVKLDLNEKVGGNRSLKVVGDLGEEVGGNHSEAVTGNLYLKSSKNVVIEGTMALTLKVGGNFVKIDPSGVTIMGTQVKINSGGAAGSGSPVSLTAPEAPVDADSAEPGKDVTYSGGVALPTAQIAADLAGITVEPGEEEEREVSWIEIELVDEEGQPVPGERYEITAPDGQTIRRGSLDQFGQAHVSIPTTGNCQISFLDLDGRAWERGTGAPTSPAAGPAAAGGPAGTQAPSAGAAAGPTQAADEGGSSPAGGEAPQDAAQDATYIGGEEAAEHEAEAGAHGE